MALQPLLRNMLQLCPLRTSVGVLGVRDVYVVALLQLAESANLEHHLMTVSARNRAV